MDLSGTTLALLCIASFVAAFFDAVVGGGGLITIPALMVALPSTTPFPTILGTNKVLAGTGTTVAALKFIKSKVVPWKELLAPIFFGMVGAAGGVQLAYRLSADFMRPLVLILLAGMWIFTYLNPLLGASTQTRMTAKYQNLWVNVISLGLGFYDGLFGPGTGSLLIFLFVSVIGFDFLRSSAVAKSVNWASNVTSMIIFVSKGSWIWSIALPMAVANGIGGWAGAHFAIEKGSHWIRKIFMVVVLLIFLRLLWQTLTPWV